MATLKLDIPDAVMDAAKSQASAAGHASVEAYVAAVIEAELATVDDELEAMLVTRLNDPRPSLDSTPELWRDVRDRVRVEIDRAKKAAS
jgi:hypothetical protein